MAEDDTLDNFLAGNTENGTDMPMNNAISGETPAALRPKLKKIKRAKVRPAIDIPPAPEKIMPDVQEPAEQTVSMPAVSAPVEDNPAENIAEDSSATTSLVTASEAQNLYVSATQNSYVLDGLPPELDYMTDENVDGEYIADGSYVKKSIVYIVAGVCLLSGLFLGKMFFAEQKVENYGLEGVVANPDVPAGRARCGLTDKSQACIFYMLNWYRQELNGRDFYKLAAQLTGREEYMIETDNLRYANVKIKPGHFAQLNIPALK